MRLTRPPLPRPPRRSPRVAKAARPARAKPSLPAYPQDGFERDELEQLLLQAARMRANRALSD